jgi:hypothetical protein
MRLTAVLAALLLSAPLGAGEKSGAEKGSGVPAFDVLDVTGPNAAKKLCYV